MILLIRPPGNPPKSFDWLSYRLSSGYYDMVLKLRPPLGGLYPAL